MQVKAVNIIAFFFLIELSNLRKLLLLVFLAYPDPWNQYPASHVWFAANGLAAGTTSLLMNYYSNVTIPDALGMTLPT
ncbi:hypothetical protein MAPG_00221 [Magnaporthiopsis poae ATCC 64411]|uniref:Uncharacterized protein n=1 Tax=Magnaporthiopsis poae (strain ATCC 64411 / 73-15) TaxID=644358 RepID=A0A0C4DKF2_MAGP6|nr:hypothetical protein MAPG_00221 [Magnaporthiopsis poae ATCC 64411]